MLFLKRYIVLCFAWYSGIVMIEASVSRWKDVAQHKYASQSTRKDNSSLPEFAVDDSAATCSQTENQRNAQWTVHFNQTRIISQLRMNTNSTFFGPNFELYFDKTDSDHGSLCAYGPTSDVQAEYVFSCFGGPKSGRSLTVINKYSSGIKLCEVKLMECDDGYFGANCTLECHCADGDVCAKQNGDCPSQCAAGWNGTSCQDECDEGTFGMECAERCHCEHDVACDRFTGVCPGSCASGWLGSSCQTVLPRLDTNPQFVANSETWIKIRWFRWNGMIEPPLSLLYQVEYQPSDSSEDSEWLRGPSVRHDISSQSQYIEALIRNLTRNTYYDFRIHPLLRGADGQYTNASASPRSSPCRTRCSVPETPEIKNVYSTVIQNYRYKSVPIICVEWTLLSKEESHCENIQYYQILYQRDGMSGVHHRVSTSNSVSAKNISANVVYDAGYWVMVTAYNNQGMETSSQRVRVITPPAPPGAKLSAPEPRNRDVGIIAGVIVCLAVLIALILVVIFYRRRLRKYKSLPVRDSTTVYNELIDNHVSAPQPLITSEMLDVLEMTTVHAKYPENGRINKPAVTKLPPKPHFPIPVDNLEEYITSRKANDYEELRKEYMEIPDRNPEASTSVGADSGNRLKNRFINILPYDHSRVILDITDGGLESDYVNASYIDGYKKPAAYIATQGCNKWSIDDMWRMAWQANCCRIIMVTNLVEKGKPKCELYWPETAGEERHYSNIGVTLTDTEHTADFVVRTFQVRRDDDTRQIKHFHYTAWPDHGVPNHAGPIISFRRKVRLCDASHPGPLIVHCSAGVGRSGAYIALDSLLDQANAEGQVDVYAFTSNMRKSRANMIQTVEQYIFVYNALLEALKVGDTVISCVDFCTEYERLCHIDPTKGKSGLLEQFELLQMMLPAEMSSVQVQGASAENLQKNRFPHILPAERQRPYLMTRVQGTNDYINAAFLDSYRRRSAFITTQMPLPHTVIDLWRMVYEHNCATVVMLNPWDETEETYGQYWPEENEECECGPFMIEALSVNRRSPEITVRELKMTFNQSSSSFAKDEEPRTINHFQFNCWAKTGSVPTSKVQLMSLLDLVEHSQHKTGHHPVIIHCHDGVRQSGLYVAISCIWEQLKDNQEVDIFQAVRELRYHRPQIIHDMEQYEFCYEIVLTYLKEFDTYSNFR